MMPDTEHAGLPVGGYQPQSSVFRPTRLSDEDIAKLEARGV